MTASSHLAGGLATSQHFWRVRGVNLDGVAGAWSATFSFTPQSSPPPPTLATIDTNPSSVNGPTPSTSTVVLSTGAPDGGAVVSWSSSNPAVASVPATTTVPSFSFTSTVTITTATISTSTVVTITATYNGSTFGDADGQSAGIVPRHAEQLHGQSSERNGRHQRAGRRRPRCGRYDTDSSQSVEQQFRCGVGAGQRHGARGVSDRGVQQLDNERNRFNCGDALRIPQCRNEDRDVNRDRRFTAATSTATSAAAADRGADGECERPQRRTSHVESHRDQRPHRQQWDGIVQRRCVDYAVSHEWPRSHLVRGMLERRQQDEKLHVHAQCGGFCERERAVVQ